MKPFNLKSILFLLIIISIAFAANAQTKKQPVKKPAPKEEKVSYKRIVKVDLVDYNNMINGLSEWRRLVLYDPNPNLNADQKISLAKNLDTYINSVTSRVKLDSVTVPADSITGVIAPH